MKIIDERGRLFGKINMIDFLVIMFLLCIFPAFYFGYKITTKKPVPLKVELVEIETDCQFIKLKPEDLKLIAVGDKELSENGQVLGEIISLGQSRPYKHKFYVGGGKPIEQDDPILRQITARLRLKAKETQGKIYYKGKLIELGSPLEFKTNKYSLFAIPFEKEEDEEMMLTEIEVFCQFIKLKPEDLKLIAVGDKELNEQGKIIGEIISLGESGPYKYELEINEGEKTFKEDPILRQIKAKLELKGVPRQNRLYYKDKAIQIGSPFTFKTNNYILTAVPFKKEELKEREVDLYVKLKDLDEDTTKKVSVGDREVDENGKTVAEILDLGKIESSSLEFNLGAGNFVMGEDSRKKQISAKMSLKCQVKDGDQLYFKGRKLEYNTFFEFKTDEYRVKGLVAKTFKIVSPLKEKWMQLQVKFSDLVPEIANIVQKGHIEKDSLEKTTARISSIITDKPSQVLTLKENSFITLSHPFNRDILAFLEVRCIEKDGIYYFKNYSVKMGNNIVFSTDLYSITGLIVGMEIK